MTAAVSTAGRVGARNDYLETGWTNGHNPWVIALVVSIAVFMEVLDTSIANVSLPHIAGSLSATEDESTWILTSYLIANAVVLPVSGWASTRMGRKRFYMTCAALFMTSSFLCGLAPTLGSLFVFRVLQGIGGGGLAPSAQAVMIDTFPAAKRGPAMAVYGMAIVLAPAIGPTLGGFITDHASWRWIFFINVPVGLLSLWLTSRVVSDPPHLKSMRARAGSIDYVGLGLVSLGLGCFEFVLDKGQEDDWFNSSTILGFAVVACMSLAGFVAWEWREKHPVIDIRMFRNRNIASTTAIMLLVGVILYAPTILLPAFEQVLMGYTAEQAGETMSPGGLSVLVWLPLAGALTPRVDPRILAAIGCAAISVALVYMAGHLYLGVDFKTVLMLRVYQMAGFGFLFVPINTIAYAGVPPDKRNAVAGMINLARNVGGSAGIAFVTTLIARRSQVHQSHLVRHADRYDATFVAQIDGVAKAFQKTGTMEVDAARRALGVAYREVAQPAALLAYLDAIRVVAIAGFLILPLLLLAARPPKVPRPAGGH